MPRSKNKILIISDSGYTSESVKAIARILEKRPSLIAIVGKDCQMLENICDDLCEKSDRLLDVVTTSHPGETVEQARELVELFDQDTLGSGYLTFKI